MSENIDNRNIINPSMVNEGWSKMKGMLDQEMPTRKNRFAGWIWILLGAFLITGTTLFIPALSLKKSDINKRNTVIAKKPATMNQRFVPVDTSKLLPIQTKPLLEKTKQLPENLTGSIHNSDAKNMESSKSGREKGLRPIAKQNSRPPGQDRFSLDSKKSDLKDKVLKEGQNKRDEQTVKKKRAMTFSNEETVPNNPTSDFVQKRIDAAEYIELLPIKYFVPKRPFLSITIPDFSDVWRADAVIKTETHRKIDFLLGGGGFADVNFSQVGWELKGGIRYPILKHIAIGFGMGYWQMNSTTSFNAIPQIKADSISFTLQDLSMNANSVRDTLNFAATTNRVRTGKLHYLSVPVYIQFFPQNKWQPRIGFSKFFYTRSISAKADVEAANPIHTPLATLDTEAIEKDLIRKTNTSIDVGLSYQAGEYLLMDVGVRWGFKSYLNYTVDGDLNNLHRHYTFNLFYKF